MQAESRVAAEQTRGINPQRQIGVKVGADLPIAVDRLFGVALDPSGLHFKLRMILPENRFPLLGIMRVPRLYLSPNRRLPHQPRLGWPASLAVEEITGVGGGIIGGGGGGAPAMPIGA